MNIERALEILHIDPVNKDALITIFGSSDSDGLALFSFDEKDLLSDTLNLIETCTVYNSFGTDKSFSLKYLGKNSEKDSHKKEDLDDLSNASSSLILSNSSIGFEISKNNGNTKFIISGKNLQKDSIESSLKSWLSVAETEPFVPTQNHYEVSGYAKCIKYPSEKSNDKSCGESLNYVSAILDANVRGNYTLSIIANDADKTKIYETIEKLSLRYRSVERLSENIKNLSLNTSDTHSVSKNLTKTVKQTIIGGTNESGGTNFTLSLSHTHKETIVNSILKVLETKITDLTRSLTGGLKSVTIFCTADNTYTFNTVTAIVKSALSKSGYETRWITSANPLPAIEIINEDIHKFFCLPCNDFPGFERVVNEKLSVNSIDYDGELDVGKIYWNNCKTDNKFVMSSQKLNRHVSVFGMTGSCKSNTVFGVIIIQKYNR